MFREALCTLLLMLMSQTILGQHPNQENDIIQISPVGHALVFARVCVCVCVCSFATRVALRNHHHNQDPEPNHPKTLCQPFRATAIPSAPSLAPGSH